MSRAEHGPQLVLALTLFLTDNRLSQSGVLVCRQLITFFFCDWHPQWVCAASPSVLSSSDDLIFYSNNWSICTEETTEFQIQQLSVGGTEEKTVIIWVRGSVVLSLSGLKQISMDHVHANAWQPVQFLLDESEGFSLSLSLSLWTSPFAAFCVWGGA